jgi:NADPH:quinone reductase-like Zn-dependent oxidoreductase
VYAAAGGGGFGELVAVRETALAPMPANASYEQAAAVPIAAITALLGLRTVGGIQPGMTVLINGASGGVGTFAVQIARALGATVVGVCSTRNVELIRSLGASEVIDYTRDSYPGKVRRYDLVLDNAGSRPVSAFLRAMKPHGTFVVVGGQAGRWVRPAERMVAAMVRGLFASQRTGVVGSVSGATKKQLLLDMNAFIEDGSVTPVIDRSYPFAELKTAVAYQEEGHSPGKVVVTY